MNIQSIEIITSEGNYPAPFTHRVLILCHEKNIPYKLTPINTYQKPDWFLAIAPLGLVSCHADRCYDPNVFYQYKHVRMP